MENFESQGPFRYRDRPRAVSARNETSYLILWLAAGKRFVILFVPPFWRWGPRGEIDASGAARQGRSAECRLSRAPASRRPCCSAPDPPSRPVMFSVSIYSTQTHSIYLANYYYLSEVAASINTSTVDLSSFSSCPNCKLAKMWTLYIGGDCWNLVSMIQDVERQMLARRRDNDKSHRDKAGQSRVVVSLLTRRAVSMQTIEK